MFAILFFKGGMEMKKMKNVFIMLVLIGVMNIAGCQSFEQAFDIEQTQATQQPETTSETVKDVQMQRGMTEAEQAYFLQAKPNIEQIITDINSVTEIITNASDINVWKEAIPYAENCIKLGGELENLQGTEESKVISELVQLFGYNVRHGYENFIESLETANTEKLQDWFQINMKDIFICLYEVGAYAQEGKTIQEQMKEEMRDLLNEEEIESIVFLSGSNFVTFQLEASDTSTGLIKIYEILSLMAKKEFYEYLDISFGVKNNDGFVFLKVDMTSQTRNQIDFDTFEWVDIPETADSYTDKF